MIDFLATFLQTFVLGALLVYCAIHLWNVFLAPFDRWLQRRADRKLARYLKDFNHRDRF